MGRSLTVFQGLILYYPSDKKTKSLSIKLEANKEWQLLGLTPFICFVYYAGWQQCPNIPLMVRKDNTKLL